MIFAAVMDPEALGGIARAIVRLQRGDSDALGAIISQYQHRLYRYLLRLTKNPATADDLFQQTWVRVMEKIGRFDAARNFEPWLFSIARNLAMDHFRTQPTEPLDAKEAAGKTSCASGALHQLLDFERSAMLAACMNGLPAIHREVLTLRFEEGMKLEEIADVAGVPLSTVKSRLHRALEGLRTSVEKRVAGRKT
jgi:RNA polymerase sigma-70 factor (ECF subfamily)